MINVFLCDFFVRTCFEDTMCILEANRTNEQTRYSRSIPHIWGWSGLPLPCSGSTRMKNSAGLDVDVQNERKSSPLLSPHLPRKNTHGLLSASCTPEKKKTGHARALLVINTSHSNTYSPQDWAVSLNLRDSHFIYENVCAKSDKNRKTS